MNKIVLGDWNYVRIYLDRSQAKAISQGAITIASTGLGGVIGTLAGGNTGFNIA